MVFQVRLFFLHLIFILRRPSHAQKAPKPKPAPPPRGEEAARTVSVAGVDVVVTDWSEGGGPTGGHDFEEAVRSVMPIAALEWGRRHCCRAEYPIFNMIPHPWQGHPQKALRVWCQAKIRYNNNISVDYQGVKPYFLGVR
jgi:hypothetical protein